MTLSEAFHVLKCWYQSVKFPSIYFIVCGLFGFLWLNCRAFGSILCENDRIGEFLLGYCMLLCSIVFLWHPTENYFSKHHCGYSTMISAVKCLSRVGFGASLVAFTIRTRTYEKKNT